MSHNLFESYSMSHPSIGTNGKRIAKASRREERANIVQDKIVIPGRDLNNYDEIGYTWDDLIPLFQKFGMDKLVLIEQECIQNYYTLRSVV